MDLSRRWLRRRLGLLSQAILAWTMLGAPMPAAAAEGAFFLAETGHAYLMPVRTIKEIARSRAFRTTLHQQYDFSCGSATVATLLTYHYGHPVDEATVFRAMYDNGDQAKIRTEGFSLLDMKRYLESHGYRADGVEVSLDELAGARVPAIALVSDNGYRHFVVVKGMQANRVVLGDPALGTRILPRQQFESIRVGGIFFVIRNHRESARFNSPADWNVRLAAPLAVGVARDAGTFALGVPDPNRF